MGASTLPLLMALKRRGYIPNGSAVIEVGAQQLDESFLGAKNDIAAIGRFFGITSPPPPFAWTGPRSDTNVLAGAPLARVLDVARAQLRVDRYRRLARQHSA
jgi:hypothetical protein